MRCYFLRGKTASERKWLLICFLEMKMAKLWQKEYSLNSLMEVFTVGNDYLLDQKLVVADCLASTAHGLMLNRIGILTGKEIAALKKGFKKIIELEEKGEFPIRLEDEDCHTAIENFLTSEIIEAGKKIHTGRSRNDQVITALRVWSREYLFTFVEEALSLVKSFTTLAEKSKGVPMPGRTHTQIAMPSSVGLWAGSFAEELTDNISLVINALELIDQSPLGSAASYGVPLPLDREYVAGLLGFSKIQNNVLYVNNSRGKFESIILDSLDQVVLTLSKIAQDLILFSLPEFGYFTLPAELCSGSSIMPQKKNPDGLELIRAKSASLSSYSSEIKNIIRSLPSGYNRDFQETKEPFLKGCDLALQCVQIMNLTVKNLQVNKKNLKEAFTPEIFATDAALELVAGGKSFRDAYRVIGTELGSVKELIPENGISTRTSTGTAGNLSLDKLTVTIHKMEKMVTEHKNRVDKALNSLLDMEITVY